MKILFVTEYDPSKPELRSGVPFFLIEAMKASGLSVDSLIVKDQRNFIEKLYSRWNQWKLSVLQKRQAGFYDAGWSPALAKSYWKQTFSKYKLNQYDYILTISPRTVACMPYHPGLIIWIDNTLETYGLYPEMQDLCFQSNQEGLQVEAKAFKKAASIYTASDYLKRHLISKYPVWAPKIATMPRGTNLLQKPGVPVVMDGINQRVTQSGIHLLHVVSGGWEHDRKGTKKTLEIFNKLKKFRHAALRIVGKVPDEQRPLLLEMGVTLVGPIDKNTPDGLADYSRYLAEAHWLLVPSKADGFGIVYAEAASFGLPSLALDVMGVPAAVKDGVTGFLFAKDDPAEAFVEKIIAFKEDTESYKNLCIRSKEYADTHFDWARNIQSIFSEDHCGKEALKDDV